MKDILFNNIKKLYTCSSQLQSHIGININTYELYSFGEACKINKNEIQWIKIYFRDDDIQIHTILNDDFDSYCLSEYIDFLLRVYKKKYIKS